MFGNLKINIFIRRKTPIISNLFFIFGYIGVENVITMKELKVFLVDDEEMTLELLKFGLSSLNKFDIQTFTSGEDCISNLDEGPDIIVLDYFLNADDPEKMNGMDVIKKIKAINPDIEVVVLSGQKEDADLVFDFVKKGAAHYIVKDREGFKNLRETVMDIVESKGLAR